MEARDILRKPIVSEKSTAQMAEGKYSFRVPVTANKTQIKRAVEEVFKVKVLGVNTARVKGKVMRVGRFTGKRADWKKATVQLAEGQSIKIFEGL